MFFARAPFRVSFLGGGSDYPTWYKFNGGKILSTSIDNYCYLSGKKLPNIFDARVHFAWSKIEQVKNIENLSHPVVREGYKKFWNLDNGLHLNHFSDLPARSGLGSSSAFTVAFIMLLEKIQNNKELSYEELTHKAIDFEQNILNETVGIQDQIACTYGGFNQIEINKNGLYKINPLNISIEKLKIIEPYFKLFYIKRTDNSSTIAEKYVNSLQFNSLKNLVDLVDEGISSILNLDIERFGQIVKTSWEEKKSNSDFISTESVDFYINNLIKAGAYGAKLLGAGGGGFILSVADPAVYEKDEILNMGITSVDFKFGNKGAAIFNSEEIF